MALSRKAAKKEACGQGSCKVAIVPSQTLLSYGPVSHTMYEKRNVEQKSKEQREGVVSSTF